MTETITLCDGKYTFVWDGTRLVCLRHGEPWRDFVGDNAVLALFRYARELEDVRKPVTGEHPCPPSVP